MACIPQYSGADREHAGQRCELESGQPDRCRNRTRLRVGVTVGWGRARENLGSYRRGHVAVAERLCGLKAKTS